MPLHRSLTEPILLGGAPRAVAIVNGTLAAAVGIGLQLWLVGIALGVVGPHARRLGREGGSAVHGGVRAARETPSRSWSLERCSISPNTATHPRASPTICRGRVSSRRASCSTRTAPSSARARFRGPDLDSATASELVATTARINNALKRLGSGWALFVEAERRAAPGYPHSAFPDAAVVARRGGAPRRLRGGGIALREPLHPDARLSSAPGGAGPCEPAPLESPDQSTVDWREQLARVHHRDGSILRRSSRA